MSISSHYILMVIVNENKSKLNVNFINLTKWQKTRSRFLKRPEHKFLEKKKKKTKQSNILTVLILIALTKSGN